MPYLSSESLLDNVHHYMGKLYPIPYTNGKHKFGLSALFMLLPGGSTVSFLVKTQYMYIAYRNRASCRKKLRIFLRLLLDWLLGVIPIIGSVLAWFYKADDKIYKDLKETYVPL